MGKTAFSGPAFGAKSLLWAIPYINSTNSTSAITVAQVTVPAGEDWYITNFHGFRGSTHSTALVLTLTDDSTSIATLAFTSSGAAASASTRLTPDAGEYDGVRVLTGSVLAMTLHNGGSSVASSGVHAWVYGYPRWIPSTIRTE
jgi:hypothetical protein